MSDIGGSAQATLCIMAKLLRVDSSTGSHKKKSEDPGKGGSPCSYMCPILALLTSQEKK